MDFYGLDNGKEVVRYLSKLFKYKKVDPHITFLRLYNLTKKRLILTSTNVTQRKSEYFDYIESPNLRVIDAMRTSMSIPFLYTSPRYNNNHYVDGGFLDNFPIHLLHNADPRQVLAIKFRKKHEDYIDFSTLQSEKDVDLEKENVKDEFQKFINFSTSLIGCLLGEIEHLKSLMSKHLYYNTTIFIRCDSLFDINVNIDRKTKKIFFHEIGPKSVDEYFKSKRYLLFRYEYLSDDLKEKIKSYFV